MEQEWVAYSFNYLLIIVLLMDLFTNLLILFYLWNFYKVIEILAKAGLFII